MAKTNRKNRIVRNIPLKWKPGQIITGTYEVVKTTSGGMAAVYIVYDLSSDIPIVIKSPFPEMVREEAAMKRFIREAEAWIALDIHPHIATCYYVRILGGVPCIFIEYGDGGSLSQRIKSGRLKELEEILDLAIQICRGMGYVHGKGMIHRDLKPANCLLTAGGTVKISDFGLTKIGEEIREISRIKIKGTEEGSVSITGQGFGTPEYMPPEQFEDSKNIDKAADIYSFGVMLYEMVCGRRPFVKPKGSKAAERENIFRKAHKEDTPPAPLTFNKDCPERLNALILKCLEKLPEKRYPSFRRIEEDLLWIYKDVAKEDYSRKVTYYMKVPADALNNKALSLLDLGQQEEAEKSWEEAFNRDPDHLASIFNIGYLRSRNSREDLFKYYLNRFRDLERHEGNNPEYWRKLSLIEAEIGLADNAKESANKAISFGHKKQDSTKRVLALPSLFIKHLEGHSDSVVSVAFTHGGRYILSGSWDHTLRFWELETGKCVRVLEITPDCNLLSVAVTPDSRYALSGHDDNALRLCRLDTGECIRIFEGHTYPGWVNEGGWWFYLVRAIAVTPDGKYAVSGGDDHTLTLWDLRSIKSKIPSLFQYIISPPTGQPPLIRPKRTSD